MLSKINPNAKSTEKKIIPVVVHVIHNFGSENVTDAQVNDAIRILNDNINGTCMHNQLFFQMDEYI